MILLSLMVLRALGEPLGPKTRDLHLVAVGILAVTVLVGLIAYRRQSQGQDSGSGAALVLELHRRLKAHPLPGDVEVWFGFLGCSYAYHGGMRHFLNLHGKTMASPPYCSLSRTLVLRRLRPRLCRGPNCIAEPSANGPSACGAFAMGRYSHPRSLGVGRPLILGRPCGVDIERLSCMGQGSRNLGRHHFGYGKPH